MPMLTVQQTPYLPLVGRSGVAPSRSSSEAIAHQERATLGWGLALTPPGALKKSAPPSPSRGGMEFVAWSRKLGGR